MNARWLTLLALLIAPACGDDGPATPMPDARARTCDESVTFTTVGDPPCTWEWDCSDFSGTSPQYSANCVAGNGDDVVCECREAGAVTGTMTLANGCSTTASACAAANAACGFSVPITCL